MTDIREPFERGRVMEFEGDITVRQPNGNVVTLPAGTTMKPGWVRIGAPSIVRVYRDGRLELELADDEHLDEQAGGPFARGITRRDAVIGGTSATAPSVDGRWRSPARDPEHIPAWADGATKRIERPRETFARETRETVEVAKLAIAGHTFGPVR
ncbi:MAG: hypothetical protein NT062_05155 [Proteobacteria bacterium]|nr:hypothetical protein [Pseudomonadota bacterium]